MSEYEQDRGDVVLEKNRDQLWGVQETNAILYFFSSARAAHDDDGVASWDLMYVAWGRGRRRTGNSWREETRISAQRCIDGRFNIFRATIDCAERKLLAIQSQNDNIRSMTRTHRVEEKLGIEPPTCLADQSGS